MAAAVRVLSGGGACRQMGPNELDHLVKCGRISNRQLRKRLPIQLDPGRFQTPNELAVGDRPLTAGCVQSCDPECADDTLAVSAIAIGVDSSPDHRLACRAIESPTAEHVALGPFHDSVA